MPTASPLGADHDWADTLVALTASEGSGGHPYIHSAELNAGPDATRNLADAVHSLSMLHGRLPGMIEIAGSLDRQEGLFGWYMMAAAGFAAERSYLAHLVVAAGMTPSTPGQAACETAMVGQQRALDMLARSDRTGCALGAAAALMLDWQAIRAALDTAADRLGVPIPQTSLPAERETLMLTASLAAQPGLGRAMLFGARQLCAHHRSLWDLLEARQQARAAAER